MHRQLILLIFLTSEARSQQELQPLHHGSRGWGNRSLAAYRHHVQEYRPQASSTVASTAFWNQYRPAFTCPLSDRVGRPSDGGKWVCNWQALLSPPSPPSPGGGGGAREADCVIYSFGISQVTMSSYQFPRFQTTRIVKTQYALRRKPASRRT